MPQSADALPDDAETLKAMLIAERIRSERLVQIIKELQRHRFGRRAETLPADQLLLALEDVEQSEAETVAQIEAKSPAAQAEGARKRHANRGALPPHLPRFEVDRRHREQELARAVGANFTASAKTSARGLTSSPLSSGCWSCVGQNTPAAPAKTWWCKLRRRRG